jgi:hypothetical protein
MARVNKLTPARLKQIIAEEKRRLGIKESKPAKRKSAKRNGTPKSKIRALHELRQRELRAIQRLRRLYKRRKELKADLIRSL